MQANIELKFHTQADRTAKEFEPKRLLEQLDAFKATISSEEIGFFRLPKRKNLIPSAREIFQRHRDKTHFVQVGIGGSALGPQALIDALQKNRKVRFFFMDNTDSEHIADLLEDIEPGKALFYIVSKSGSTAETVANFSIAKNFLLASGIKENELKNHFVLCTDPDEGQLRELAKNEGFDALEVPKNIGGRFSVLSHVGLLPALFAGIDVDALLQGAADMADRLLAEEPEENILLQTAAHIAQLRAGAPSVNQTILMPYSSKLKTLSHWFVQLWGESLGKIRPSDGANIGLTPIPAYGATDQHSQMQLFMEGPSDKLLILLEVKEKRTDFKLDSGLPMEAARKLAPFSLNQLIESQFNGTLQALREMKKNVVHLSIQRNDESHMGALMLFFESLTAMMGHCLEVDPFDQPGVELGKKLAYEYLKNLPEPADK